MYAEQIGRPEQEGRPFYEVKVCLSMNMSAAVAALDSSGSKGSMKSP